MGAHLSRLSESIASRARRYSTGSGRRDSETPDGSVETGHDPAVHGARLEDRNYNNETYKKRPVDPHETQQRTAGATTIQAQFRQKESKEEVLTMREEDAAIKIQAGFRGHIDRTNVRKMKDDEPDKVQEDDVDIDLSCPDVEKAAIKIQAGFKGFKARKEALSASEEASRETSARTNDENGRDLHDPDLNSAASKIQAGFRGHSTRQLLKERNEKEPPTTILDTPTDDDIKDIDLKDPDLSKAALKIQAGFRGIQSRKELQMKKEAQKQKEEVIDIDLTDPDVKKSAVLIQAGFKGLKARKHMRQKAEEQQQAEDQQKQDQQDERLQEKSQQVMSQQEESQVEEENNLSEKFNQEVPEIDNAALKIQAAFRGYSTRKIMKEEASEQQTAHAAEATNGDNVAASQNEPEEEVDIDLTDPAVQSATMKLQAGFKGFKARKAMQSKLAKAEEATSNEGQGKDSGEQKNKNEINEGVTATGDGDGEVVKGSGEEPGIGDEGNDKEKAITKIQAGFRGMKAREQVKAINKSKNGVEKSEEEREEAGEEGEQQFGEEPDEM